MRRLQCIHFEAVYSSHFANNAVILELTQMGGGGNFISRKKPVFTANKINIVINFCFELI